MDVQAEQLWEHHKEQTIASAAMVAEHQQAIAELMEKLKRARERLVKLQNTQSELEHTLSTQQRAAKLEIRDLELDLEHRRREHDRAHVEHRFHAKAIMAHLARAPPPAQPHAPLLQPPAQRLMALHRPPGFPDGNDRGVRRVFA